MQAQRVAMAVGPDLVGGGGAIREGVAGGGRAIQRQPHDGAEVVGDILRRILLLPLAAGDEEIALVGRDRDLVRIMPSARYLGALAPDHVQPLDPAFIRLLAHQRAAAHDRAARIAVARFGPAEIDGAPIQRLCGFAFEEGDIAKTALAAVIDPGQAGDGAHPAAGHIHELHRARLLGNEGDGRARRKGQRPWFVERAHRGCRVGDLIVRHAHRAGRRLRAGDRIVPARIGGATCEERGTR